MRAGQLLNGQHGLVIRQHTPCGIMQVLGTRILRYVHHNTWNRGKNCEYAGSSPLALKSRMLPGRAGAGACVGICCWALAVLSRACVCPSCQVVVVPAIKLV